MPAREDPIVRFWRYVNKDGPVPPHVPELGPCWVWTAARRTSGYGAFGWTRGQIEQAHRVAWRLTNGEIPAGIWVLHKCDNPPCVRPEHLFLGDAAANSADKWAKGRGVGGLVRGERHGMARLTFAQVTEIRRRYEAGERNQSALAREYNVTSQQIGHIVRGEHWRHAC